MSGEIKSTDEIATSHPDACSDDLFGSFDENSEYCVQCLEITNNCAIACKALTEFRKTAPVTSKVKKEKTSKIRGKRGGAKVLLCGVESASGKCEALLCQPEGATMEEMVALRGAVSSLLNSLKKAGFNIVKENGRYYYRPEVVATETTV